MDEVRAAPSNDASVQADRPVGRSMLLRDYRKKHGFGATWTSGEIKRGRLKTYQVGRDHRVTEQAEREHIGLLEQEAAERRRTAGAA